MNRFDQPGIFSRRLMMVRRPADEIQEDPGDSCPDCKKGKVYEVAKPGVLVRTAGQAPEQCRHVLETLGAVYKNDAFARQRNLSPEARLQFHQDASGPVMDGLQAWLARQFEDRLVELNSGLGEAISYMVKHWEKLTLFLREPGAPLDNNICERALKKAVAVGPRVAVAPRLPASGHDAARPS